MASSFRIGYVKQTLRKVWICSPEASRSACAAARPAFASALQTLPITRVKRIIKQDGEVKAVSTDANYAIAKAAVSFGLLAHAASDPQPASAIMQSRSLQMLLSLGPSPTPQEMLLDKLVQGAADKTMCSDRKLLSYSDVGALSCLNTCMYMYHNDEASQCAQH